MCSSMVSQPIFKDVFPLKCKAIVIYGPEQEFKYIYSPKSVARQM